MTITKTQLIKPNCRRLL